MAGQEQDQDKTEQPTPFKLREAKKRGQVAKSMEFNSFMIILVMLTMLTILAEGMIGKLLRVNTSIISNAHDVQFTVTAIIDWLSGVFSSFFSILAPLFLLIVVVAVLMNLFQTGPIFSFFPIKPDVQRINPVAGFKRLFSTKLLFESFKSIIKIGVFGGVIYLFIVSSIPDMIRMMLSHPDSYAPIMLGIIGKLVLTLAAIVFLIAILDLIYTRWDFMKKMRMSRRELKDEIKRREGDPQIRAKIKEVQKEAAKRTSSINKVPEADVLITNPTHLAIAIQYKRDERDAPEVIAKGAGDLAKKMKEYARKHNVPILENRKLARALFKEIDIGEMVSEDYFAEVARILVWAYSRTGKYKLADV